MPVAKWLLALVVAGHVGHSSVPVHAQSPAQSNVILRPVRERAINPRMGLHGDAPNPQVQSQLQSQLQSKAQSLTKCIAGWRATSDMTREEWLHSCEVQNKGASSRNAFAVCLADWDAATHMSKQEWRSACVRAVQEDPTAFH